MRKWARLTASWTRGLEEKGSFRVVGMFCSSTTGARMSTSSSGLGLSTATSAKPWRRSMSRVAERVFPAVAYHTA